MGVNTWMSLTGSTAKVRGMRSVTAVKSLAAMSSGSSA
jgi:hypothetical protein